VYVYYYFVIIIIIIIKQELKMQINHRKKT